MINFAVQDKTATRTFNVDPDGSLNHDLYYYKADGITLPKGGRALVDVLKTTTDYERVYETTLKGNGAYRGYSGYASSKNTVWSALRFLNNSGKPFTTGAAFVTALDDGIQVPVAQEQLNFTPANLRAYIRTSQSPDITVHDQEEDISGTISWVRGWNLLTFKGTIDIVNFKDETVNIDVKRTFDGHLKDSDHPWDTAVRLRRHNNKNKLNEVIWHVKLEPGKKKKITYTYRIWVKN